MAWERQVTPKAGAQPRPARPGLLRRRGSWDHALVTLSLPGSQPLAKAGQPSTPPSTTLLATGVAEVARLTSGPCHLNPDILPRQE